jgi:hypothetical protein
MRIGSAEPTAGFVSRTNRDGQSMHGSDAREVRARWAEGPRAVVRIDGIHWNSESVTVTAQEVLGPDQPKGKQPSRVSRAVIDHLESRTYASLVRPARR